MRLLACAALAVLATPAGHAEDIEGCATFVAVEGKVEVRNGAPAAWTPATLGTVVCTGESVRVDEFGRAALQLPDQTLLRLSRNTELTLIEPENEGSLLSVLRGILHVISRDPRALKFTTPYANAGLEGTEFLISVADAQTRVDVIEGEVVVGNADGQISVAEGQRAVAQRDGAPRAEPIVDRFAAARWTPYYAPILYLNLPSPDQVARSAERDDPNFFAARAARRLSLGAVGDGTLAAAETDIDAALRLAPLHPTAQALSALIALDRGDKNAASEAAMAAVASDAQSVPALIALSHVQQASFELDAALETLHKATTIEPDNALAWAWLAELRMSRGDTRGALVAAERAATLDPDVARVQTVLGFASLEQSTTDRAAASFERAIELDQGDPLPHLGLGLALLRRGELVAGREQVEIAVLLAPSSAQIRSYMAKIYAEENRLELTETQLRLARVLDPSDPTPDLYQALNQQAQSDSVAALHSLNSASAQNDGQPVFRSTLRIDEDLAVRSFGVGHIHKDLNFEGLALLDGWKATTRDPEDYAAHRLLADLYPATPRQEIARVNELYRAQLLLPLDVMPVPTELAETNLFILRTMGPSELGFSEYGPLTRRDGLSFLGSGIAAGNDTEGVSVSIAGLNDRLSYGAGHFGFETEGFRPNNDLDQEVTNAFLRYRPNAATSLQAELRGSSAERGDVRMLFDPSAYNPLVRQTEDIESLRFGARHSFSTRSTLLATAILEDQTADLTGVPGFGLHVDRSGATVEVQHLKRWNRVHLTSGIRHLDQDSLEASSFVVDIPFPPFQTTLRNELSSDSRYSSAYAYATVFWTDTITALVGAAADQVDTRSVESSQISPKLGLMLEPTADTTIRLSALQTLEGPLVSRFNIQPRLEPTHVMGFNQYFFGSEGEETTRAGVAIDHEVSPNLFTGVELSERSVDLRQTRFLPDGSTIVDDVDRDEQLLRGYLYWTPAPRVSVAAEYQHERVDGNGDRLVDGFEYLETQRVPISVNLFNARNLHTGIRATYITQEGAFAPFDGIPAPVIEPGSDSFWIVDLSLSYRLPKRHGIVSVSLDNALDEEFRFQDTDPENQSIMPERMLAFRFTMSY